MWTQYIGKGLGAATNPTIQNDPRIGGICITRGGRRCIIIIIIIMIAAAVAHGSVFVDTLADFLAFTTSSKDISKRSGAARRLVVVATTAFPTANTSTSFIAAAINARV